MMVVDLRPFDAELTGKVAQSTLDEAGITLNKNTVPDDPRSPFVTSGLRIGTPSVTTQGMTEAEMATIAELIARALRERNNGEELSAVRKEVAELCARFRLTRTATPPRRLATCPTGGSAPELGRIRRQRRHETSPDPNDTDLPQNVVPVVGSLSVPGTGDYLIIGAVAAVVTLAVTPLVGRLARSRGGCTTRASGPCTRADPGDRWAGHVRRVHLRLCRRPAARPLRPAVRPQLEPRGIIAGGDHHPRVGLYDDVKGLRHPPR